MTNIAWLNGKLFISLDAFVSFSSRCRAGENKKNFPTLLILPNVNKRFVALFLPNLCVHIFHVQQSRKVFMNEISETMKVIGDGVGGMSTDVQNFSQKMMKPDMWNPVTHHLHLPNTSFKNYSHSTPEASFKNVYKNCFYPNSILSIVMIPVAPPAYLSNEICKSV